MNNNNKKKLDIAGREHWDSIYNNTKLPDHYKTWLPTEYNAKVISLFIKKEIEKHKPLNILEVGCGNSKWLGYLAKKYSIDTVGIDYSAHGCELARRRLEAEKVDGKIVCCDMFDKNENLLNRFDIAYSIGLVEHFDDLQKVITVLKSFLRPNGVLITVVPNLFSIHGLLSRLWHPELLRKHIILRKKNLIKSYSDTGFSKINSVYGGVFSLSIIQWNNCTRWPQLGKRLYPTIGKTHYYIHSFLDYIKCYNGIAPLSPYIMVSGKK